MNKAVNWTTVTYDQVQDLTEQVQSKTEADDAIMVAVNNKIEEWQVLANTHNFCLFLCARE